MALQVATPIAYLSIGRHHHQVNVWSLEAISTFFRNMPPAPHYEFEVNHDDLLQDTYDLEGDTKSYAGVIIRIPYSCIAYS